MVMIDENVNINIALELLNCVKGNASSFYFLCNKYSNYGTKEIIFMYFLFAVVIVGVFFYIYILLFRY